MCRMCDVYLVDICRATSTRECFFCKTFIGNHEPCMYLGDLCSHLDCLNFRDDEKSSTKFISQYILTNSEKTSFSEVCSICRAAIHDEYSLTLECGHYFHTSCISPWLEKFRTCPLCRHSLRQKKWTSWRKASV